MKRATSKSAAARASGRKSREQPVRQRAKRLPAQERRGLILKEAAVFFAEPDPAQAPPARFTCPVDAELTAPASPGALGDALSRARACVERQLRGGRDWRRLR